MLLRAGILVFIVAALLGYLVYTQQRTEPFKVSGFIEADEIRVGSRVGGRVAKTLAVEGASVKSGELLIELAPYDLLTRQSQVQAQLQGAQASVELAQSTYDRIKSSFDAKATSATEMDRVASELKIARATESLRKAELEQIAEQIKELKILSPCDGVVQAVDLQPGDLVAPNAPVLSLLDMSHLWVRTYIPENRLNVQKDQKVTITIDSFPDRTFAGHVTFVSPQAEFTPNNVQTPEERSKQVFRIKVALDEGLDILRAGMTADVWLDAPNRLAATQSGASP
jgi:RND family efflux transporter MFP subunit